MRERGEEEEREGKRRREQDVMGWGVFETN